MRFLGARQIAGKETYGVAGLDEGIVDSDNVNVFVLDGNAEDDTTDTTEAVDSNLGRSHDSVVVIRVVLDGSRCPVR